MRIKGASMNETQIPPLHAATLLNNSAFAGDVSLLGAKSFACARWLYIYIYKYINSLEDSTMYYNTHRDYMGQGTNHVQFI